MFVLYQPRFWRYHSGVVYKKKEDVRPQKAHPPIRHMQVNRHLPCKTMIIDFTHSFKDYDEILNFYGVWGYYLQPIYRHAK